MKQEEAILRGDKIMFSFDLTVRTVGTKPAANQKFIIPAE